uniref:Uncharacterized protein n=1 Tax=Tanacetum cinerariifolium TaxID=118510 RepID=A0A699I600_TANCI|nr:hypothetical protein [Tanacetum cinerariifolium]
MTEKKPKEWMKWLSLDEYWYNSNSRNSIKTTPFEVVYGQPAPIHISYTPKDRSMDLVDRTLQAKTIALIKFNLKTAQDWIKSYTDRKRKKKMVKQGNRVVVYGLIQWSNGSEEDATWELLTGIETRDVRSAHLFDVIVIIICGEAPNDGGPGAAPLAGSKGRQPLAGSEGQRPWLFGLGFGIKCDVKNALKNKIPGYLDSVLDSVFDKAAIGMGLKST